MGTPPQQEDREAGTREDGEAMAPAAIDPRPDERAGNPLNQDLADGKVPSEKPSFSSFKDEPLATAGIVGSDDPKGRVRSGGGEVPADSPEDTEPESGYLEHPDRKPAKKPESAVDRLKKCQLTARLAQGETRMGKNDLPKVDEGIKPSRTPGYGTACPGPGGSFWRSASVSA
jgi:hypothetical protein